jgi:hypothetical protein
MEASLSEKKIIITKSIPPYQLPYAFGTNLIGRNVTLSYKKEELLASLFFSKITIVIVIQNLF